MASSCLVVHCNPSFWARSKTCSKPAIPQACLKQRHQHSLIVTKASSSAPPSPSSSGSKSIICPECTGNGAKSCTSCKGDGVNLEDHFGGRFKTGEMCWLCRGKRQILCGNCNGAGFVGGFLSTVDD
ncbi:uncharacterized protein LOC9630591 [Selaginella moellendorffii]|nr:uncharacterized protein LOC9630591 [Selaginella moellendorffii]|eukprot:XP_002975635.2 uncharacterized protein LOC9630591 [Selaginella moellendorffii]